MAAFGPLLLVGCGKMGGALLSGWLQRSAPADRVVVIEPQPGPHVADFVAGGVTVVGTAGAVDRGYRPKVVVLAVKPQSMDEAAVPLARFARPATVFLSIAAGTPIATFEALFGAAAPVVRAMPNTPAAVGRGITVLTANAKASAAQRTACADLMKAVGEVAWVEDEGLMDAITAVSGSGPAYVFLLVEALAEAGAAAGLPPQLAQRLARAAVSGSGELLRLSAEDAATLRQNVTSPGGTTEAALDVLMAPDGLRRLMIEAVAAAAKRSRELAG